MEQNKNNIKSLIVKGFKSIRDEITLELKPLTILAGANNSGKSSIIKPFLLIKQTVESYYDYGALSLTGGHISFDQFEQLLWNCPTSKKNDKFIIGFIDSKNQITKQTFQKLEEEIKVVEVEFIENGKNFSLNINNSYSNDYFLELIPNYLKDFFKPETNWETNIISKHSFLGIEIKAKRENSYLNFPMEILGILLENMLHLSPSRGWMKKRYFEKLFVGDKFPSLFQNYTASIILKWQEDKDEKKLLKLGKYLEDLGLTWRVKAIKLNDATIEIRVARTLNKKLGKDDLVNIADVGVGVSKALPILVALLTARKGQLVYIEEPELNLHPKAQVVMAKLLAEASIRGVRLIIETHSSLLLLAIQTLVAKGELDHKIVGLNWFERDDEGATIITTAELDAKGRFGDWPVDFTEVEMDAEMDYLDAGLFKKEKVK